MPKKKYFTELESLRGIAAILVCIFHVRYWSIFKGVSEISHFDLFVDFFFVLSGFVIALSFSTTITNSITFKNYLVKRFFRLYPLFLFASIPYLFTSILKTYFHANSFQTSNYFEMKDFLFYISLTFKWGAVKELIYNHPSWSISVELLLYILAGFLFLLKRNRVVNIIASMSLALVSLVLLISFRDTLNVTDNFVVFRGIFSFFIGMTVFYFFNTPGRVTAKSNSALLSNLFLILTISLIIVSFGLAGKNTSATFVFPLLWALLIYFIINNKYPSWFIKFLNLKYVLYLGTISYSFYLMHPIMIFVTEKIFNKARLEANSSVSIAATLFYVGITIMCSKLTYEYIELPGKDFYKRFNKADSNKKIAPAKTLIVNR